MPAALPLSCLHHPRSVLAAACLLGFLTQSATTPVGALAASLDAGLPLCLPAAVALYCLLGCLMDFPATVAISTTGLAISPHFDQPYASESMASFWGRRWNVATSNTLRSLIYDPIYEGGANHLTRRECL